MKQPLQPAGQILCATAEQDDDLTGTQKPVPVNEPDDFLVALNQPDGRNRGNTLKARKAGHQASMKATSADETTCEIVYSGKLASPVG
jgi:hypothetical protein